MKKCRIDEKAVQRLDSFLERNDIKDIDNTKIDSIRMLVGYLRNDVRLKDLTNFLKK